MRKKARAMSRPREAMMARGFFERGVGGVGGVVSRPG